MKAKFSEWLAAFLFTIIGGIFVILGTNIVMSDLQFRKTAVEDTAIVSNIESYRDSDGDVSYNVYVDYTVSGVEYKDKKINYYTSGMSVGKEITIYYNADSPEEIRTSGEGTIGLIFVCIGSISTLIGLIMISRKMGRIILKNNLIKNGRKIDADIEEIELNTSYSVNRRNPFVIICKWTDDKGKTYFCKSENIWQDPNPIIEEKKITKLSVYVDENNYNKCYVSVDEIFQNNVIK